MTSPSVQSQAVRPSTSTSDRLWRAVAVAAIGQQKAQQQADELATLLALLADDVRPGLIIELGLGDGGLAWALTQLPSRPTVLSVSLSVADSQREPVLPDLNHHVIWGDTHEPRTRANVANWVGAELVDVLVIDADHTYSSARQDWLDYSDLVRPGGLVVFHDVSLAVNYPQVQVHRLWAELQPSHRTLTVMADPFGLAGMGLLWLPD